jgi:glycosyltransferase involved in cell wall biosynthesis
MRPDVILAYTGWANVICGLTWRFAGASGFIWNQRDVDDNVLTSHRLEKRAVRGATAVVANSKCSADFLSEKLGILRERIQVVHNGVPLNQADGDRDELCRGLNIERDSLLACMVGNLRTPKDHATLVSAWKRVVDEGQQARRAAVLLLAGFHADTYDSVKSLVAQSQLEGSVRLLGHVKDVPSLLRSVDLGVFSSLSESFPNGVLECMGSALPVVGTDIPGIREVVGEDNVKYLAPPRDAERMAQLILAFLTDGQLRKDVGRANRHRVETEFSLERMLSQTTELIRGCVDRGSWGNHK